MIAVYTAIYGGYDRPKTAPAGVRCVLFTDDRSLRAPGWEVRYEPLAWIATPMLQAKYWKTHPSEAVPDADATVWIDGSIVPGPRYATRCLGALDGHDVALTPHPLRDCIYDECDASASLPKYDALVMYEQVRHYRYNNHPEHWGLFASGAIARRNNDRVNALNEAWWQENIRWSWQDQLSLPFVLRRHPDVSWSATMPWAKWWGYVEHGA